MLEFAEHVVLNARRMWSEFPLRHRRRMRMVLFREGITYDGEASRTAVTCLFFRDLEPSESEEYELVALKGRLLKPAHRRADRLRFFKNSRWLNFVTRLNMYIYLDIISS